MSGEGTRTPPVSRRGFITATVIVASSTAGCSDAVTPSFEADPVVLPDEDQENLWLSETVRDSATIDVDGPSVTEVEVTNHMAVYNRAAGYGGT
jgi:hypothetical protein